MKMYNKNVGEVIDVPEGMKGADLAFHGFGAPPTEPVTSPEDQIAELMVQLEDAHAMIRELTAKTTDKQGRK